MMKNHWAILLTLCTIGATVKATPNPSKHGQSSAFPSYKGLVMAGYQGWFNAPDDGAGRGWNHYVAHGDFAPGNCKIDLWPDVSEYQQVYKTPFTTADGQPTYLPSSYDASTTDLHFRWMKQYGIDGVFVQRFIGSTRGGKALQHNDKVLAQCLDASRKYGRAIAVMYDLSGMKDDDTDPETVIRDWRHLVDSLKLTSRGNHQTYLYHNGKPLVAVWGVGFPGRSYGLKGAEKIIDFLKNDPVYGGCSVLLGVPTYWRTLDNDAMKDPQLHDVLRKADIVQPWFVGRYNEDSYPKFKARVADDVRWCTQNHLDYVPVVFPGFSWHNMYPKSPQNQIPRNHGRFFWEQLKGDIDAGAQMLYIAMFDEIDEGTAIFKLSKHPPSGPSNFVTPDPDIPGDYYLTLAGDAAHLLRHEPFDEAQLPRPEPISFVDPLIGSGGHGHVFVGASTPFGAVQLGPENFYKGWDWCSGYNYGDSVCIGFAHTHLSGTGIGDLGDILIMPYTGNEQTSKGTETIPGSGYASRYSHSTETAKPGYYAVTLSDYNIRAELTATDRVGFHQYHFPAQTPTGTTQPSTGSPHSSSSPQAHLIIDLQEGINDRTTQSWIRQTDPTTFEGCRRSKGWAKDQTIFFAIKSSVPITSFHTFQDTLKGLIDLPPNTTTLQLKIGISPTSAENALKNIESELPGWDFNTTANAAKERWNRELSKVELTTTDEKARRIFYTALYHTMIDPALFNDAGSAQNTYSVFSLWDTYRAENPLLTILQPNRAGDMVRTMIDISHRQKLLPIWHLEGNETGTMVGVSSLQIIAEAILKGIQGFNKDSAWSAIQRTTLSDTLGWQYVRDGRPIPDNTERRAVARAMEYAIGEGSVALLAKHLGYQKDYEYYRQRAKDYRLYYDKTTGFFRGIPGKSGNIPGIPGKSDNIPGIPADSGHFSTPFDPFKTTPPWSRDYAEGNAWQYLWLTPQDPYGLMNLLGGEQNFLRRLDSLFTAQPPIPDTHALADITGTIGQYAHGNEPSHHIAYLYAYAGHQWQTAEKIRYILKEMYHDNPDGVIGNEDCGQMSAWYVFSALGFYPVFPASGVYVMGSPLFEKATIHLDNGKTFTVQTTNNGPGNKYIQAMELNGKPYPKSYILHNDIMEGGTLKITMGPNPNKSFGQSQNQRPPDSLNPPTTTQPHAATTVTNPRPQSTTTHTATTVSNPRPQSPTTHTATTGPAAVHPSFLQTTLTNSHPQSTTSDSILIQLNKRQLHPGDTLSFSCDVPSFARDSTVGSLHLILEDIHTNRRWQYRYPIINGSASGDLVVGGGIQDGNYAVNFIVQSRFFRVEGKVKDYKEKLSPLTYVVMIRNKPGFMERIVPDPDGTFRLKPAYIEDTAYYVFSPAKRQQSSTLWLDIRTPMDSTFVPFASATKFITVASRGDSIPLLAPSNYRFDLRQLSGPGILQTVTVAAKTKKAVDRFNEQYSTGLFRNNAYMTFDGLESDAIAKSFTIYDFLRFQIPGFTATPNNEGAYTLRWRNTGVSIFLDEFPLLHPEDVYIDPAEVAMIKVYQPPNSISNRAGVIAVYTKRGDYDKDPRRKNKFKVAGYTAPLADWQ